MYELRSRERYAFGFFVKALEVFVFSERLAAEALRSGLEIGECFFVSGADDIVLGIYLGWLISRDRIRHINL